MGTIKDNALHYLLTDVDMIGMGLLKGKSGQSLFYFLYSRYCGYPVIEDYAEDLLYEVTGSITNETPIWFENGLAGIGWVVIYLYQNQYIDGDVNIILNCCDRLLTKRDVRRINDLSLEKGLRGIACYVSARIEMDLDHPLLDDQFIHELFERCKDLGVSQYSVSMEALCEYMIQKSNASLWKDGICTMFEKQHEEESSISN